MTGGEFLKGATDFGGLVSVGCALYVAFRDARWRKQGLFAQLMKRIGEVEDVADDANQRAGRWHESTEGQVFQAQVNRNSDRISRVEEKLENFATKTDIAHVEGAISRVEALLTDTAQGVDRIEGMLMKKALG